MLDALNPTASAWATLHLSFIADPVKCTPTVTTITAIGQIGDGARNREGLFLFDECFSNKVLQA